MPIKISFLKSALFFIVLVLEWNNTTAQNHWSASFSSGVQYLGLNWSIAGTSAGNNPNIYSELIWKKLKGWNNEGTIHFDMGKRLIVESSFKYTSIQSGEVTDIDYQLDNRQNMSFLGLFDSNRGLAYQVDLKAGWKLITFKQCEIKAFAGFFTSGQKLYLLDNSGKYDRDLKSTYLTFWRGGLIGTEISLKAGRFEITPNFSYYQSSYRGTGDWNLITNFEHPVSYRHSADGFGVASQLSIYYKITRNLQVLLKGRQEQWKTGKGTDILYLISGEHPVTLLNEVFLKSNQITAGVEMNL